MEPTRAHCPRCRTPVEVPFAQRTIEVSRVCENCGSSWRVVATPVKRLGLAQVTNVAFSPEA